MKRSCLFAEIWKYSLALVLSGLFPFSLNAYAIGQREYVQNTYTAGSFPLVQGQSAAAVYMDAADWPGARRAAQNLVEDLFKVTGRKSKLVSDSAALSGKGIIAGTIGKSTIIDRLVQSGKIDVKPIAGKWESFFLQTVSNPFPNISSALVVVGSDKRGTIYGIYDLCEQMGVSPLHWWADVPVRHREALFIKPGKYLQGSPSVKYRGIFLNDEAPDLSEWVREKYGNVPLSENPPIPGGVANYDHRFYEKIFEAILRMKGNYLWPAMWNNAFNEDDPENARLADEYGIVMGNSHQEPMLRAQKEWDRRFQKALGSWNYYKNPDVLQKFWREGLQRNRNYESIITIGLRGANDTPMIPGGTVAQSMALLEEIVGVQRKIIAEEINPDVASVPQLWCLYKEVQEYYNAGLRVPDDVTLLWADDNWGNIRRLPTEAERKRSGGAGIYYHFDYVGGPRNYKWINTVSLPSVWEQMTQAKEYGADRIWIVNVGHFKHLLFPMEFFLQLGWDAGRWTNRNLGDYTRLWAAREFGPQQAGAIAEIMECYSRYAARRKPELLSPSTYSPKDYREAERVVAEYSDLVRRAEQVYAKLPQSARDAFYELVLFPVKACAQVNELYITAAKNALYAQQGRALTNDLADKAQKLFDADAELMKHYNLTFAGGKWNHFMDQVHIGYTMWNDPPQNVMPKVVRTQLPQAAAMGLAVEGSSEIWPGNSSLLRLPRFDGINRQQYYIDVFNRGQNPFEYSVVAVEPWIKLSSSRGTVQKEARLWVSIDWLKAPQGTREGKIRIRQNNGDEGEIAVAMTNPSGITRDTLKGFIENDGYVSMEAEHFTANIPAKQARWEKIDGYGRTLSAMTILPMKAESILSPKDAPCLEYKMYLFKPGKLQVLTTFAPALNYVPGRSVRFAISFDDNAPQILDIVPKDFDARNGNREWEESVRNAARTIRSSHEASGAGYHTLKIRMVDPGVVLQKIVVDLGGLKPSYLGPPESYRGKSDVAHQ
jgi:hypothetical protein